MLFTSFPYPSPPLRLNELQGTPDRSKCREGASVAYNCRGLEMYLVGRFEWTESVIYLNIPQRSENI